MKKAGKLLQEDELWDNGLLPFLYFSNFLLLVFTRSWEKASLQKMFVIFCFLI